MTGPPAFKRFMRTYGPIADAVARLDIDQEDRERVAEALTQALDGRPDFRPSTFRLLASDPLCPCAGPRETANARGGFAGEPCPHGREIRIAMHNTDAPDGRSFAWAQRRPTVRCVSCGAPTTPTYSTGAQ